MAKTPSEIHSNLDPRNLRPVEIQRSEVGDWRHLSVLGVGLDEANLSAMSFAMDAAPDPVGVANPNIPALAQQLQEWLPGFVNVVTTVLTIDKIIGRMTVGSFEDEEIIQGVMEPIGLAQPYGDRNEIPLASWNLGLETRTIMRFEAGADETYMEGLRSAKARVNSLARKRAAASKALDIERNRIGFYGYNSANSRLFGFLNDPNLPAYVNVNGGAWSAKTFLQISADIREAVGALIVQGGGHIVAGPEMDGEATPMTLALPLGSANWLSVTNEFGQSVSAWLKATYPNIRVTSAPELQGANGGANVFYLFAERIDDGDSDDDGRTFAQLVPTVFKTIGTERRAKVLLEDFANATAGVMLKRPFAVVRRSGI